MPRRPGNIAPALVASLLAGVPSALPGGDQLAVSNYATTEFQGALPARSRLTVSQPAISRFEADTGTLLGVQATPGGTWPDLVYGPDGNLYYLGLNTIQRLSGETGELLGNFVSGDPFLDPRGLTFGPDGRLYVSDAATGSVLRYDGSTGIYLDTFLSYAGGGLGFPRDLEFGPDGDLYVVWSSGGSDDSILRYEGGTGVLRGAVATHLSAWDLVFDPDGDLYVADPARNEVSRFHTATGERLEPFASAGASPLVSPSGLAFGPDGALYVSSSATGSVLRFDAETGAFLGTFAAGTARLPAPLHLAFAPRRRGVQIEIEPGSLQKTINPGDSGTVAVAILSSPVFNAPRDLDRSSLTFGRTGSETSLASCDPSPQDVNQDGLPDQVCRFYAALTGLRMGDTQAVLRGRASGGVMLQARHSVAVASNSTAPGAWSDYRSDTQNFSFRYPAEFGLTDKTPPAGGADSDRTLLWLSGAIRGSFTLDGANRSYVTSLDVQVVAMDAPRAASVFSRTRPKTIGGLAGWIWIAPGGSEPSIHAFVSRGSSTYVFTLSSNRPGWIEGPALSDLADQILATVQFGK